MIMQSSDRNLLVYVIQFITLNFLSCNTYPIMRFMHYISFHFLEKAFKQKNISTFYQLEYLLLKLT